MWLSIIQFILAIILIILISLQQRGTGLGASFGGSGEVFRTKRGVEKTIFTSTIIFSFLFFGAVFLNLFI